MSITYSRITELYVAQFALPALFALTFVCDATTMSTAIDVAKGNGAIIATIFCIANTLLGVWIEFSMVGAVGETGNGRLVFDSTVESWGGKSEVKIGLRRR